MKSRVKVYDELLKKYGNLQIVVAIEELSELQKELTKSLRGKANLDNIIEELADTQIMIEQMMCRFNVSKSVINEKIKEKIERTKRLL